MISLGESVRKSFGKSVKLQSTDLGTKANFKIDLGSPLIKSSTAFSSALAGATYTSAFSIAGDNAVTGTVTTAGTETLVSQLVTLIDGVSGVSASFVEGTAYKGINSYIYVLADTAASSAGDVITIGAPMATLLADLKSKLGGVIVPSVTDVTNGVYGQVSFQVAPLRGSNSSKAYFEIDLGSNSLTTASVFPVSALTATSNVVVSGDLNTTYTLTSGAITGTSTTLATVLSSLNSGSGTTVTFIPGSTGVEAKIRVELDTAGENFIDASDLAASGEIISKLNTALGVTNVKLGAVVSGTAAFDKFISMFQVSDTTGEPVTGFTGVFDRNTGKFTVANGSTGVLAAGYTVTYLGQFGSQSHRV